MMLLGGALAAVFAAGLGLVWLHEPAIARALLAAAGFQLLFGREAAIPIGLGAGAPAWAVFVASVVQDMAAALVGFGLFLAVMQRQRRRGGRLSAWYQKVRHAAETGTRTRRQGAFGLFLFMLLPFLINGPLIGAVAGELAGVGRRLTTLVVFSATAVSAAMWTAAGGLLVALMSPTLVVAVGGVAAAAACTMATLALRSRNATAVPETPVDAAL